MWISCCLSNKWLVSTLVVWLLPNLSTPASLSTLNCSPTCQPSLVQCDRCGRYEFYYGLLKHGENIVVMNHLERLSDITHNLTAVVNVLKKFDDKAHQIGTEGQYVTQDILTPDNIQEYWRRLLTGYSKLMQFEPQLHPDAISIGRSLTTTASRSFNLYNRTCSLCGHYASVGTRYDRHQ